MTYDYFRVTGAHDTVLDCIDLFSITFRERQCAGIRHEIGTMFLIIYVPSIPSDEILESL